MRFKDCAYLAILVLPIMAHSQSCPTSIEVKNAETSASSITLNPEQKAAKNLVVKAMKRCPRKLLCSEISQMTPSGYSAKNVLQIYLNEFNPSRQPYLQIDSNSYQSVCSSFK